MLVEDKRQPVSLKGKILLLLTKHFPFNDGNTPAEAYLETEIELISHHFASVVVVATEAATSSPQMQETPKNVSSFALGLPQSHVEKAACLVKGVLNLRHMPEAAEPDFVSSVSQTVFRRYYIGKALRKWGVLKELLSREAIDPTHVYSFWFHDTALMACWVKREYLCARAVARAHRYDLYHDRTRCGLLPCREYQLECLDAIIPCSEDGTAYLKAMYPDFSAKIKTGYLGTHWLPDMSGEGRGDVFRIVSCSAVAGVKRVTTLAKALGILDSQGIELEWTHYGDGPELPAVKEVAKRFSTVRCRLPGYVANAALLDTYGKEHYDLFVNVSESEGLPISIMEASGHGIPVLATDVGGTHEIVIDGVNGRLIPEQCDARDIAAAIIVFLKMRDEDYASMRAAARRQWESKFQTVNNVSVLVEELLLPTGSKGVGAQ